MGRPDDGRNYTRVIMSKKSSPVACFSVSGAAQYLGISRTLFYRLIRERRIKTVKIGARTIVRGVELERFLDRQQAA